MFSISVRFFVFCYVVLLATSLNAQSRQEYQQEPHYILAQTGQVDTEGRTLVSLDRYPSINNQGYVAVMGKTKPDDRAYQNIFVINPQNGAIRPILKPFFEFPESGSDPTQTFGPPQINNSNVVLSRRRTNTIVQIGFPIGDILTAPFTYLEKWDATATQSFSTLVALGDGGAGPVWDAGLLTFLNPISGFFVPAPFFNSDWDGIHDSRNSSFPGMNNRGETVFATLASNKNWLATTRSFTYIETLGEPLRARIADNGNIALVSSSGRLYRFASTFAAGTVLADSNNGFDSIGQSPGISDDGKSIVFTANVFRDQYGLGTGKGVFVYYNDGQRQYYKRICGIRHNGKLDPGEVWRDWNNNQVLDVNEDEGPIADVDKDGRLGASDKGTIVFKAYNASGKIGIFAGRATPASSQLRLIAQVGQPLAGGRSLISDLDIYDPISNVNGQMVFWAQTGTSPESSRQYIVSSQVANLIALDGNRDEEISSDDDDDRPIAGKPFLFWLNDDRDVFKEDNGYFGVGVEESQEDLQPESGKNDNEDAVIRCTRDLEDFTRLHLFLPVSPAQMGRGWECRVTITDYSDATKIPQIRIFQAVTPGREYLTDPTKAQEQLKRTQSFLIKNGVETILPQSFFANSEGRAALIFEGVKAGKGALQVRFIRNGKVLAQDKIYLELKPISTMYDHWYLDTGTHNWSDDGNVPWQNVEGKTYNLVHRRENPVEDTNYILFVHGWRMLAWERKYFAETVYKRLWQRGYRGAFGCFTWPCEWVDADSYFKLFLDPQNFNRSERKAYLSAHGLHDLLAHLSDAYQGEVSVLSHSQGAVVVSEALRLETDEASPRPLVKTYVASQGAMAANAYDPSAEYRWKEWLAPKTIPDVYRSYPPTQKAYFARINEAASKVVNFHNKEDYALGNWRWNQNINKPDIVHGYNYYKFRTLEFGFYRWFTALDILNDRYEIFAHSAPGYSYAVGEQKDVKGPFTTSAQVNLNAAPFNFGGDDSWHHSAQFLGSLAIRFPYYDVLLTTFGLKKPASP